MYTHAHATLMARTEGPTSRAMSDRLRHAGYHDGERHPRHRQHWVNYTSIRRMSARL